MSRVFLGRAVVALWLVGGVVLGAALLALHVPSLPAPAPNDARLERLASDGAPRWRLIHALYADCGCSSRVLDHVIARGKQPGFDDRIILIGEAGRDVARAAAAGFQVEQVTEAVAVERFGIEGAPVLIVADPSGALRYVGGYNDRKQSLAIRDLEILGALQGERPVTTLPIFGCAVSARLKAWVDPLGLKSPRPRS